MAVAELVLQYLQVLAWPIVVGTALVAFRRQLSEKIGQLKDVNTPLGGGTFFDKAARQVEASADAAAQDQASEPVAGAAVEGPPARESPAKPDDSSKVPRPAEDLVNPAIDHALHWLVSNEREFEMARKVAMVDPNAAVLTAFRYLEQIASDGAARAGVPPRERRTVLDSVDALHHKGLTDEFTPVVRDLTRLRNDVSHGGTDVSLSAALSFIAAAERVGTSIRGLTLSRAIHPSNQTRVILGETRVG